MSNYVSEYNAFMLVGMLVGFMLVGKELGPIRCGDTKCLVLLRTLCCHLWRDININTNRGRVLGKVSCTKNLPLGEYLAR